MNRVATLVALACLAVAVPAGADTVYKWTDKAGKVVYGTQPPQGVKAEAVQVSNKQLGGTLGGNAAAATGGADTGSGASGTADTGPAMTPYGGSWRAKQEAEEQLHPKPKTLPRCPPGLPKGACK